MQSNQRERELSAVIDGLEMELRRARLWEPEPPSEHLLESPQPFCVDTLALSQWLQWLLIPRMRRILAGDGRLPTHSAIGPYAADCFEHLDGGAALLVLIERLDGLIRHQAGAMTQ